LELASRVIFQQPELDILSLDIINCVLTKSAEIW